MIGSLKLKVEMKFGRKISYQKDCNALSNKILESQKEYISPATLRRVFGFLSTNSNPSRVTLDILSRYIGYKNWENFNQSQISTESTSQDIPYYWEIIKENSKVISSNTVEHIKIKSGIEFSRTVKRQFTKEFIKGFTNSNLPATAIIGPGGYGKSTMLANWYIKWQNKKKKTDDVVLFISAQMLDQFASTDIFIEVWLMRLLGLKPESSFFSGIIQSNIQPSGKFILIIDALDEITSQGAKQEKILKSLVELADNFSMSNNFKLIVSTRLSTWKLLASFCQVKDNWLFTNPDFFTIDGANIPPLNFEEIQNILDNTLNERFSNRILVYEMHPDLKKIISYPYFLQLFIQVYTPEIRNTLNDELAILSEFLKKQVYYAHFSDEKIDILNQIIILSEYGSKLVMKDNLKRVYPIHLKLSGNYYAAYEELISFGILIEETHVDAFGGYSKYVRVANQQLMSMLIVQNLIRKEHGIDSKLFKWIDNNLIDIDLQAKILGTLYKLCYKERLSKPLLDFFKLSPTALSATLSTPTIPTTLQSDIYMRNILIPHYARQPIARKLLFENNIDFNHIVNSFTLHLKSYLEFSKSDSDKLFANTLLAFAGFISLDTPLGIYHFNLTKNQDPRIIPPTVSGIWFANHIVFEYLLGNGNPSDWIERAKAYSLTITNSEDRFDFAESILPALILLNRTESFGHFIVFSDKITAPNHRAAMNFLFTKFYRLFIENINITSTENGAIEQIFNLLNPIRSYLAIIMGETLRASYFLSNNNLEATHNNFRNAIELSSIAGYKLVEASLMKDLANNLIKLGEHSKANECMDYVNSLWKLSGFKQMLP